MIQLFPALGIIFSPEKGDGWSELIMSVALLVVALVMFQYDHDNLTVTGIIVAIVGFWFGTAVQKYQPLLQQKKK